MGNIIITVVERHNTGTLTGTWYVKEADQDEIDRLQRLGHDVHLGAYVVEFEFFDDNFIKDYVLHP